MPVGVLLPRRDPCVADPLHHFAPSCLATDVDDTYSVFALQYMVARISGWFDLGVVPRNQPTASGARDGAGETSRISRDTRLVSSIRRRCLLDTLSPWI